MDEAPFNYSQHDTTAIYCGLPNGWLSLFLSSPWLHFFLILRSFSCSSLYSTYSSGLFLCLRFFNFYCAIPFYFSFFFLSPLDLCNEAILSWRLNQVELESFRVIELTLKLGGIHQASRNGLLQ